MCKWETEVGPCEVHVEGIEQEEKGMPQPCTDVLALWVLLIFNGGNKNIPKSNASGKTRLLFPVLYLSSDLTLASHLCFRAGSISKGILFDNSFVHLDTHSVPCG